MFTHIVYIVGVYGDVIRVKIMFNKKDNALVQFADPSQANTGTVNFQSSMNCATCSQLSFYRLKVVLKVGLKRYIFFI